VVAVVAGLVGASTFALFSDTEESPGNTFQSGTLDLEIHSGGSLVPMSFTNMAPGVETGTYTLYYKNVGSIPGTVKWGIISIAGNDPTCTGEYGGGDVGATAFAAEVNVNYVAFDRNCDGVIQDGGGDGSDYTFDGTGCGTTSPVTAAAWAGLTGVQRRCILDSSTWGGAPGGINDEWVLPDWARWADSDADGYLSLTEIQAKGENWTIDDLGTGAAGPTTGLDPYGATSQLYKHEMKFMLDAGVGNPFQCEGIDVTIRATLSQ